MLKQPSHAGHFIQAASRTVIEAIGVNGQAYLSRRSIPNWVDSRGNVTAMYFHVSALIIVEIERYHWHVRYARPDIPTVMMVIVVFHGRCWVRSLDRWRWKKSNLLWGLITNVWYLSYMMAFDISWRASRFSWHALRYTRHLRVDKLSSIVFILHLLYSSRYIHRARTRNPILRKIIVLK